MTVPFNRAPYWGGEEEFILQAMKSGKLSGDGPYGKKCQSWFETKLPARKVLLTPSCTAALEMAAILIDLKSGDEVIMPSYTFVSTANAFVLRGAKIVFVDVCPRTMNIDAGKIEQAISSKTRAIVPVHYAGVGCQMDKIMMLADKYNLYVIEDAAQGMMSSYKGKALGTIGHLGAISFHETKNYTSGGEGGLLIINDEKLSGRAEVIREKGTNRNQFFRGMVDKYQWIDIGGSFLPSELQSAYLWGQLQGAEQINNSRIEAWNYYYHKLMPLQKSGALLLPEVPGDCQHNAHMFYIKTDDLEQRTALLAHLKNNDIHAAFHYVPLHSASAGIKYSRFNDVDAHTTKESEKLLRLPMFYGLDKESQQKVVSAVFDFYQG